jgi:hypothetical protein
VLSRIERERAQHRIAEAKKSPSVGLVKGLFASSQPTAAAAE